MVVWNIRNVKEQAAFKAMFEDSDRGAAIVAASFVENFIEYKLRHLMRSDDANVLGSTFEQDGPLATFSSKIKMGFLLRLLGKKARNELDTIRKIRNYFAHKLEDSKFSQSPFREWCNNLKLVEGYHQPKSEQSRLKDVPGMHFYETEDDARNALKEPRIRFLETCGMFVATFGYGNYPIFLPIHDDDRQMWPILKWHIDPLPTQGTTST